MPSSRAVDPEIEMLHHVPPSLHALVAHGVLRTYRKGTLIIDEGSHGDTLYVVLKGHVKAFSSDARGREVTYGVYGAGEYFGEMSLDGGPRSASVMAMQATTCAVLARQTLRSYIAANPDFAFELISRVIHRARAATINARNMALLDVYGRVVQLLDSLASPPVDGVRLLNERLTHADIAARVGCSREMVSRLLKDLERGGYTEQRQRHLVLLKRLPPRW